MQPSSQPVTGTPSATAADTLSALEARRQRLLSSYADTLRRYTEVEQVSICLLYETAQKMLDTSGGSCCAKLLLGLYNGRRFPFDLTDLRSLDSQRYAAARTVIDMDARRTWCEVHVLLNAIYGDGRSTGAELENWAWRLRWGKHAKKADLPTGYGPKWTRAAAQ